MTDVQDTTIVSAAIYPPIGVCRVGNSPSEYYIGPEVNEPAPLPPGSYRDDSGRIKREAARFRIYGLNAAGQAVAELTADTADIEWQVALANQKSSWYEFQLAQDVPEAAQADPSVKRNLAVADRDSLTIAPSPQSVSGTNHKGDSTKFDDGTCFGQRVYLGELHTDDAGRLIVLGGHGKSASNDDSPAITFANNEGWYDDTSDGPVTATVTLDGVQLDVAPAWVICAPPNYGPQIKSVRTMWDLMRDTAVSAKMLDRPAKPSFQDDIRPIFERMTELQWVNAGFAAAFGFEGPFDFSSPEWLARLNDATDTGAETRRVLYNNFRVFDRDSKSPVPWPWLYGDAMNVPPADTPRQHTTLSDLQMGFLAQWVEGDFIADYDPNACPPASIDAVPVADQPDMLTRAAMEFCLADAFHPGCEMTWPMRQAGMYASAFRLKTRDGAEPDYGQELTPIWDAPGGPVNGGQSPGSITRWMAVPWQTDTASCRSGYTKAYDPYVPTFWPARVPNEVVSTEAYGVITDTSASMQDRIAAFTNRADWLEPLGPDKYYQHQINHMIHHFDQMGIVEVHPGPEGSSDAFPATIQVSDQPQKTRLMAMAKGAAPQGHSDLSHIDKVQRLPVKGR
ncbi:LodA/GoxA family CTQ-dependent oxidase [Ascidiaceihabitans sp.]|uniref:LodA/GoxA family CTQ-dependent oxidase n=1 Tax=Ascidiaceihabitans sp. TaxID=1872644 RepID=UPI00329757C6